MVVAAHVTNPQIAYDAYNATLPLTLGDRPYGNLSIILPVAFPNSLVHET